MASSDASQLAGAFDRRLALQGSLSCCWGFLAMTFADPTTGAATKRPAGLESAGEADAAGDASQLSAHLLLLLFDRPHLASTQFLLMLLLFL